MFGIKLPLKIRQIESFTGDRPVAGFLVCQFPETQLGRVIGEAADGAQIVEYPAVSPSGVVYWIKDAWYCRQVRQAMESDGSLYDAELWEKAALTATEAAISA